MKHNTHKFVNYFIMSLLLFLCNGCAKITEQARLDRFQEKLTVNELEVEKKLNDDLSQRNNNLTSLKKDIVFLKSKIKNIKNNKDTKIKDSYDRYVKSIESQTEVELIYFEIEMLNKLSEKEEKLVNIKKNINKISTQDEQATIKSLKKDLYKLNEEMENLYIDISWYESVNRVNLINAQKSSKLINESNIYLREGNFNKAIFNVEKAKRLTPNIPIIYAQLGSLYYLTDNKKKSLLNYKKAGEFNYEISGIMEMITLLEKDIMKVD